MLIRCWDILNEISVGGQKISNVILQNETTVEKYSIFFSIISMTSYFYVYPPIS